MSKILLIEDDETMRDGMSQVLKRAGHDVVCVSNGFDGIKSLSKEKFDLVITDFKMEGMDGMEVLEKVKSIDENIEVLMITAYGTIDMAVEAMRKGAFDYVTKPFSPKEFIIRVEKAIKFGDAKKTEARLDEENKYLRHELDIQYNFGEIVGASEKMKAVFEMVEKIAKSDSAVMIYGESGTGKEMVARAIHFHSNRKDNSFVKVNCGALAEGVLESELFGHEKGSFTGAIRRKLGRFELADKGTIFLDEIGDIPTGTQIKLLRVLQEKEFERVGGEETISVDVRVIAATNKDLRIMVEEGKFREDLFYRLQVIPIELPPLRERKEDIPMLIEHFLEKKSRQLNKKPPRVNEMALKELTNYYWPGNVRELENLMERAVVLCEGEEIGLKDLSMLLGNTNKSSLNLSREDLSLDEALEDLERQLIERALEKAKGVKTEAARILGLKTSALYYKLEKYGMI
ncbi:TPA: sigma-54-dependent Fis family transcriptional regulator [Candidatus Poribacteria bacterium]|nr:sigma-54-dependent Fis family transcriptional regulator [Candidatus Poribacteria bacterium]